MGGTVSDCLPISFPNVFETRFLLSKVAALYATYYSKYVGTGTAVRTVRCRIPPSKRHDLLSCCKRSCGYLILRFIPFLMRAFTLVESG